MTLTRRRKEDIAKLLAVELATHDGRCCFCNKHLHTPVWHRRDGEPNDGHVGHLARAGDLDELRRELPRCSPAHASCRNQHRREKTQQAGLYLTIVR